MPGTKRKALGAPQVEFIDGCMRVVQPSNVSGSGGSSSSATTTAGDVGSSEIGLFCTQKYLQPHVLQDFTLIEKLGAGSFGLVCLCREKTSGRRLYAIKQIQISNLARTLESRRLLRELRICRVLRKLQTPHMAQVSTHAQAAQH
jgi:serine/threonine protein kinase